MSCASYLFGVEEVDAEEGDRVTAEELPPRSEHSERTQHSPKPVVEEVEAGICLKSRPLVGENTVQTSNRVDSLRRIA